MSSSKELSQEEKQSIKEIASKISGYKKAIVFAHVHPDADALGSAAALVLGLKSLGMEVHLHLDGKIKQRIGELVKGIPFVQTIQKNVLLDPEVCLIAVDTANQERVDFASDELKAIFDELLEGELKDKVFNIDHHISNPAWAGNNLILPTDSACASIVLEVLESMSVKIDKQQANLLFAALSSDTGSFRFSNTNARTFEVSSRLLAYGADVEKISNILYYSVSYNENVLRGLAISEISLELDSKVAFLIVTNDMLKKSGTGADDTEGLVDEVRAVKGTVAAVMIRQREGSLWKASLRSKIPELSVNNVAKVFSGGGHKAASGCTVEGDGQTVKKLILEALSKELSELR